jgi:hypothetical protein
VTVCLVGGVENEGGRILAKKFQGAVVKEEEVIQTIILV